MQSSFMPLGVRPTATISLPGSEEGEICYSVRLFVSPHHIFTVAKE